MDHMNHNKHMNHNNRMNHMNHKNHQNNSTVNPCTDHLSDLEYIEHMIPHHQVAVDISIMLQNKTTSPRMQRILRELIRIQTYEIQMMNMMKKKLPRSVSDDINNNKYTKTGSDFIRPNKLGLTNTYCDPHFLIQKLIWNI